jgi:hypothetical protein
VSGRRSRVTGWFVEPDERAVPLLLAMGNVVWAAAGLEKSLLLELTRLRGEREGQLPAEEEISKLERLTAGPLLEHLRKLELPSALAERIADAIDRRNALFHRPFEDPDLVFAVSHGERLDAQVEHVEQLALDCGELAVELLLVAVARLVGMIGIAPAQMLELVQSIDIDAIEDPRYRGQLEAVRALSGVDLATLLRPDAPAPPDR